MATGRKTRALHHLRQALANQEAFQTLTGTADPTAALARIALYGAEVGDLPDRMFVILRLSGPEQREKVAVGTFAPAAVSILVVAEGEITVGNQDDWDAANDEASDDWDALRAALEACDNYSYDGALLRVSRVDELIEDEDAGPFAWPDPQDAERIEVGTECPYWQARATVTLGGGSAD